jgi:hypothetical protein
LSSTSDKNKDPKSHFRKYFRFLFSLRSPYHKNIIIFLFFVLVSTCFWFTRSLSEQYDTVVTYPVKYINYPENKVLIGKVPDKLKLRIRAKGFVILKRKLNLNLIPLKFNVNSFSLNSIGTDTFYIITETVKDLLSEELDDVKILDISPDTLFFRFTDMMVKKVAVRPVLALNTKFFQNQYMQNGDISLFPDSIIVSGPGNLLQSLTYVQTEPLEFTNLSDTMKVLCNLERRDMLTYSQNKVQVSIPVDRFTEVEENLSVIPINVPDSMSMIAIPGQVKITYKVCLSNYQKVKDNPPIPKIDFTAINEKQVGRLTVFISDTPQIISNIRFNPKEIEFLITRK